MKQDRPPKLAVNDATTRVVVYRLQPTTFLGRIAAFVIAVLMLVGVFLFSLLLFSVLLVGTLLLVGYALWRTRRMTQPRGRVIDADHDRSK